MMEDSAYDKPDGSIHRNDGDKTFKEWWMMTQVWTSIHRSRSRELSRYGVTPEQAAVLFIVKAFEEGVGPSVISKWLVRSPHTISSIIDRMVNKGLVKKTKDRRIKNLVRVKMTERGEQAHDNSLKRESLKRILGALSEEEQSQLVVLLEKLRKSALKEFQIYEEPPFP